VRQSSPLGGVLLEVPLAPTLRLLLLPPALVAAVILGRFVAGAVEEEVFTESTMMSGVPDLVPVSVVAVEEKGLFVAVEVVAAAAAVAVLLLLGRREGRVEESALSTRICRPLRLLPLRAAMLFSTPAVSAMVMKPKQVGLFLFLVVYILAEEKLPCFEKRA